MKDYLLTFRIAVHRAKDDDISDDSEFVNNFMWEHSLYGKDIYDKLLHEIQQMKDNEKSMKEIAIKHGFSITPRSSNFNTGYNKGEVSAYGTAFI